MNSKTKPDWRLVPVEPTKEMWAAVNKLDDEMAAGGFDGRGCSIEQAWNCLLDSAPTPQASEPVAEVSEVAFYPDTNGKYQSIVLSDVGLPVGTKLFDKPQQAKPCERCAEYVRYCPECGSVGEVASTFRDCCPDGNHAVYIPKLIANKLAALEAENARLTNAASPLLQTMEVNAWRAVVTGLCLRFPNSPEDAREQIKGRMQEQDKARKQAQADLETYKGRCTDLEGEIDKERQRRWSGNAESSRELAELTKQLAAAQKDAERYRWIFDNCEIRDEQGAIEDETQLDAAIAAQK